MVRVPYSLSFFFFNDTATTEIYPLSLHDALPISPRLPARAAPREPLPCRCRRRRPPRFDSSSLLFFPFREERFQLGREDIRNFLGNIVRARHAVAAHIVGDAAPFVERLEAAPDDATLAPQREERALHPAPGVAVGAVVHEVDGGGGAVILAARLDGTGR